MKKTSKNIKELGVNKQYTQVRLANLIDVIANHINLIENGKSKESLDVFYKLSKIFGIMINELLDIDCISIISDKDMDLIYNFINSL